MKTKETNIKKVISRHITNNKKEYIIFALIFVIGIFLGVLFVNNAKENQKEDINTYISDFVNKMKNTENIDNVNILKSSIKQNILLALGIWFFGTTVIRNTNCFWNCYI